MKRPISASAADRRLGIALSAPALIVVLGVALFPLVQTLLESLHLHTLYMPWLGRPFIGLSNYRDAWHDPRFWEALTHTLGFVAVSVSLELSLGLLLALLLHRPFRGRGVARTLALLPWALPGVVGALVWKFAFEGQGVVNRLLSLVPGVTTGPVWFGHPQLAWVPIVLADVWKTTPFVALLLLAGLSGIDRELLEAARIDGAGAFARFRHVTLPALRPAFALALLFRTLDAFRIFDLVYVLTGGGPGTATEPLSLYAFTALLRDLRFGYGSALALCVFAVTALLAGVCVAVFSRALLPSAADRGKR